MKTNPMKNTMIKKMNDALSSKGFVAGCDFGCLYMVSVRC